MFLTGRTQYRLASVYSIQQHHACVAVRCPSKEVPACGPWYVAYTPYTFYLLMLRCIASAMLTTWFMKNGILLNLSKTETVLFGTIAHSGNNLTRPLGSSEGCFQFCSQSIYTQCYSLLIAITMPRHGSFADTATTCTRALRHIRLLIIPSPFLLCSPLKFPIRR